MQINLLHKVLNYVLNYKFINLNKNYFDNKILDDKLLCTYHNFTIVVFLPQITNTKKHTKLLVKVQYMFNILVETFCSFIKDILLVSTIKRH